MCVVEQLKQASLNKIAFRSFQIGDLALFLPTRHPNSYAAFHMDSPHYFLQVTSSHERYIKRREWLVGRILHIETKTADALSNPFDLPLSTEYHVVQVDRYKRAV
jgi:hypothetical protein